MVSSEILVHENFLGLGIDVTNVALGGQEDGEVGPNAPYSAEESRQLALRLEEISARRQAAEQGRLVKVKVDKSALEAAAEADGGDGADSSANGRGSDARKPHATDYEAWARFDAQTKVEEVTPNPPRRLGEDVDDYGYKEVEVSAEEAERLRREQRGRVEAGALREAGNEAFREGRIDEALAKYVQGIALCPDSAALHANASAAYLRAGRYREAAASADSARRLAHEGGAHELRLKAAGRLATALSHLASAEDGGGDDDDAEGLAARDEAAMEDALADAQDIASTLIMTKSAREDAARVRASCVARIQDRKARKAAAEELARAPKSVRPSIRRAEALVRALLDRLGVDLATAAEETPDNDEAAVRETLRSLLKLALPEADGGEGEARGPDAAPYVIDVLRRAGLASELHAFASADETCAVELLAELLTSPGVGAHAPTASVLAFSECAPAVANCVALLPDTRRKRCALAAARCLDAAIPERVGQALLRPTLDDAEKPGNTYLHALLEATVEGSRDLLLPRLRLVARVIRGSKALSDALTKRKDLARAVAAALARALVLKDRPNRLEATRLLHDILATRPATRRALACLDTVHALAVGLFEELAPLTQKAPATTQDGAQGLVNVVVDLDGLPAMGGEVVALNLHCVADLASGRSEVIQALLEDEESVPGMLVALLSDGCRDARPSLTYPALRVISAATQLDWDDLDASLCMLGAGEALLAVVTWACSAQDKRNLEAVNSAAVMHLALSTLGTLVTSAPFIERTRRQVSECADPSASPALLALVRAWPRGALDDANALPDAVLYGLATAIGTLLMHIPSLCQAFVEDGPHPWFFADCVSKWYALGSRPVGKLIEHIMAQLMETQREGVWATISKLEPATQESFMRQWISRLAAEDPAQLRRPHVELVH